MYDYKITRFCKNSHNRDRTDHAVNSVTRSSKLNYGLSDYIELGIHLLKWLYIICVYDSESGCI